jgi:hypothetical protein
MRRYDAEEIEIEGDLDGCKLIALAAKCAEMSFGALDKALKVFQGAFQVAMQLSVLNRFRAVDAVWCKRRQSMLVRHQIVRDCLRMLGHFLSKGEQVALFGVKTGSNAGAVCLC